MTKAEIDNRELQFKIDEYGDMLFKLCYVRLQNVQDAEDVVQDVFYQYVKHYGEFESKEHEKAWLLKTALNACRKMWRSAWRRYHSDGDWTEAVEAQSALLESRTDGGPEADALQREEKRKLLEAVLALPAKYRDVIHLFYYQGLSVKEIARVMKCGESTITSQLTRGRDILRRSLKEGYDFE